MYLPIFLPCNGHVTENAGRVIDEGTSRHGHIGACQTGAFQGQLQPEICQDKDKAIVSCSLTHICTTLAVYTASACKL